MRKIVYYNIETNNYTNAYSKAKWYIGHINPTELGITLTAKDKYTRIETKPNYEIDVTDITQLQSLVNSSQNGTAFHLPQGEFRNVSINVNGKHGSQFIGKLDVDGKPSTIINNSVIVSSWTLDGGKYKATVTAPTWISIFQTPVQSTEVFYYPELRESLFKDNLALLPQTSLVEVNNNEKFWYDTNTNTIWVNFNPSSNVMEWGIRDSFIHNGTQALLVNTENVVVKNIETVKHSGNRQAGTIGGRSRTGDPATNRRWFVKNCTSKWNRGIGIDLPVQSICIGNRTFDNGHGGIMGFGTSVSYYIGGYNTDVYSLVEGNLNYGNSWIGADSEDYQKFGGSYKLKVSKNIYRNNGLDYLGKYKRSPEIWLDFVDFVEVENNYIEGDSNNTERSEGVYSEISFFTTIKRNKIINTSGNCIYLNTTYDCTVDGNEITTQDSDDDVFLSASISIVDGERGFRWSNNAQLLRELKNCTIKNNTIKIKNITNGLWITSQKSNNTTTYQWFNDNGNLLENNLYERTNTAFWNWANSNLNLYPKYTLAQTQAFGQELGSIVY